VAWDRQGFRLIWSRISRRKSGRPEASPVIRALILNMAAANPLWGAPRIHGELLKLGMEVSERTVSRLMPKYRKPPSQTWKAFLNNHVQGLASVDFFTVPTVSFRVLFVFVVLAHHRPRLVFQRDRTSDGGLDRSANSGKAPRYLIRDRDQIYGESFRNGLRDMCTAEVLTAPQSPWQNPFAERLVGSIRRECLDHVIVLGEKHLRRVLNSYFDYYLGSRTRLSLAKNTPTTRVVQGPEAGEIVEIPQVAASTIATKGVLRKRWQVGPAVPYLENCKLLRVRRSLVGAKAQPTR
jgi:putative transposase